MSICFFVRVCVFCAILGDTLCIFRIVPGLLLFVPFAFYDFSLLSLFSFLLEDLPNSASGFRAFSPCSLCPTDTARKFQFLDRLNFVHSLCSTPSPAFIFCRLFDDGLSDWCEVVPHCSFNLCFFSNEWW